MDRKKNKEIEDLMMTEIEHRSMTKQTLYTVNSVYRGQNKVVKHPE